MSAYAPRPPLMVHASLRRIGPIEGGAYALLDVLIEVLGTGGTLMMAQGAESPCPCTTTTARARCWSASPPWAARCFASARNKTAFVRLDTNAYSVPPEHAGQMLTLVCDDRLVRLLDGAHEVARHARRWGVRQSIEDPAHREALLTERQAPELMTTPSSETPRSSQPSSARSCSPP
jgi:hypothetical protein